MQGLRDQGYFYLVVKCTCNSQQGAHGQDDQSEFPSCGEADDEGYDEGGGGLDQQPHLVTDPLLDLVDIAGRK